PARHSLDLPPREPEPAERAEESRLEAGATLSEPRVLAAPIHEPARQRVARRAEPPHPPELRQEAPPQADVLGARFRLRVLLDLVDDEVADPDLARPQRLGEREHVVERVWRSQHGAHEQAVALLYALGDLHLAFAREELDGPRLAEIEAHRVGGTWGAPGLLGGAQLLLREAYEPALAPLADAGDAVGERALARRGRVRPLLEEAARHPVAHVARQRSYDGHAVLFLTARQRLGGPAPFGMLEL